MNSSVVGIVPPPKALLISQEHVHAVQTWLDTCARGDVLIITSDTPGCGVTTMLRSLDAARDDICMYVGEPVGSGQRTVLGQKKIIVIDPLDEYVADQTRQKHVSSIMTTRPLPLIITGIRRRVSRAKIDDAFETVVKRQGVTRLHIPTPETSRAVSMLTALGVRDAARAWDASQGDFRHCLVSNMGGEDDDPSMHMKATCPDGLEALTCLLSEPTHSFPEAVRMADGDVNLLIDGVFENYLDGTDDDFETMTDVLDALTTVDTMQAYVYHDPSSEFPEIAGILGGIEFLPCHVRSIIKKHGTVWAKENHKYTKAKLMRYIKSQGVDPETAAWIRGMVCRDAPRTTPRLAEAYGSQTVWNATRLWMKSASRASYTKARHEALVRSVSKKRHRPL